MLLHNIVMRCPQFRGRREKKSVLDRETEARQIERMKGVGVLLFEKSIVVQVNCQLHFHPEENYHMKPHCVYYENFISIFLQAKFVSKEGWLAKTGGNNKVSHNCACDVLPVTIIL